MVKVTRTVPVGIGPMLFALFLLSEHVATSVLLLEQVTLARLGRLTRLTFHPSVGGFCGLWMSIVKVTLYQSLSTALTDDSYLPGGALGVGVDGSGAGGGGGA